MCHMQMFSNRFSLYRIHYLSNSQIIIIQVILCWCTDDFRYHVEKFTDPLIRENVHKY